ncbi:hypothetical protein [Aeromicrobium alkaliterrae]|uniref:ATP-binding protein n=1 Tax=Aeromicrobium alkaliterrae TaxID=302168 RepID=A0ABN2KFB7_9ACTN
MGGAQVVRTTRSGDQYHYLWASLRALRLLDDSTGLEALSIEGPSNGEDVAAEEIIDVAEYYGGTNFSIADRVAYHQLKHSSMRVDEPMTSSELSTVLGKFSAIYREACDRGNELKIQFSLVTNRRLADRVRQTIDELTSGRDATHANEASHLQRYMSFGPDEGSQREFLQRFEINDQSAGLEDVERALDREIASLVPGGGSGAELAELMYKISAMARHESKTNTIGLNDLLITLRTTHRALLPAPAKLERPDHIIRTADVTTVAELLQAGQEQKLLVTALGGVGKSVFTSLLVDELADRSTSLVFDCFAGGDYRDLHTKRHPHHIGLTQLANELAGQGLASVLIPSQTASAADYLQAFIAKVEEACERLALRHADSLLTVIIDAADNAALAAADYGEAHFIKDLFTVEWPSNFRLVALCRPERAGRLSLPRSIRRVPLVGFDEDATYEHLRSEFPDATPGHGLELHALSSGNPRVQAMAMSGSSSAASAIEKLAIAQARPGETLDVLLADMIERVATQGQMSTEELTALCEALAILHPTIPLKDLSDITGLEPDAVRSFAVALGRGLFFNEHALQFRDEPTETWFRDNHLPPESGMRSFANRIAPLASDSAYIAAALPQVFFEAGMLHELVQLALSDEGLPGSADELQSQEISRSRTRFALGAALKSRRNSDAALLAVRAGTLLSGYSRRMKMLREHPDLAARFMQPEVVEGLTTGRDLAADWPGSNLHVEAVMLSQLDSLKGIARSRVTSSLNTIHAILRLRGEANHHLRTSVGIDEIALLALSIINLDGPDAAAEFLSSWRPKPFVREAAAAFCSKLADADRIDEICQVAASASATKHLQIGCFEVLFEYAAVPSDAAIEAVCSMLKKRKKPFKHDRGPHAYETDVRAVTWALLHGRRAGCLNDSEARQIAEIHLEILPNHVGERGHGLSPVGVIVLHALHARLARHDLTVANLINPDFLATLSDDRYGGKRDTRSFQANIPDLIPWATSLVNAILDGPTESVRRDLKSLAESGFPKVGDYQTPFVRINGVAELAVRILAVVPHKRLLGGLEAWHEASDIYLGRSRIPVVRATARDQSMKAFGVAVANRGVDRCQQDRIDADLRVDELLSLSRAVLACSAFEAEAIFNIADHESELVGSDLGARWYALTNSARAIGNGSESARAHRLLEVGEALHANGGLDAAQLATPLFQLDPSGYYAAASRQRDRRAVDYERLLTPVVLSVGSPGSHVGTLALLAFRPTSSWAQAISELEPEEAETASRVLGEHYRFDQPAGERPREPEQTSGWSGKPPARRDRPKPRRVAAEHDFTTAAGWDHAFRKIEWYSEKRAKLMAAALRKSPAELPEVLVALAAAPGARESDFVTAARIAGRRPSSAGLRSAVVTLGNAFATRFASEICTRWYDRSELRDFAEAARADPRELSRISFAELGSRAHALKHEECFSLASHIAQTLQHDEAARVFDALGSLFDDLAPPGGSADGTFDRTAWEMPSRHQGIAGLIWTACGDIAARRRWQAAHAIVLLVQLGDARTLEQLASYADGTHDGRHFADPRFKPYELHSRLWTLMALERAASEPNAHMLAPFVPWLQSVLDGPPHAANQVTAQRVLQALSGVPPLAPLIAADSLNRRLMPDHKLVEWGHRQDHSDPFGAEGPVESSRRAYPFFYDFQSYWGSHLARAFGTSEAVVAQKAAAIAEEVTGFDDDERDARRSAHVFESGSTTDHRSWPREEDFRFYSAIHSLLVLGAQLALTQQALKDPGSELDDYTAWLQEYLPTRRDGRWLSDRRDPPPSPSPEWRISGANHETWPWSLARQDFAPVAGHGTDRITVSASFESTLGRLSEEVRISSALISPRTARAFLVALQTSQSNQGSGSLPTIRDYDDLEPQMPQSVFRLTPWIDDSRYREGIDEQDELGRNLRFPPRRLSSEFTTRFSLEPDVDLRSWHRDGNCLMRSRAWDATEQVASDRVTGTKGETLEVDRLLLLEILAATGSSLVLSVDCRREKYTPSYRRNEDPDEFHWIEWSSKTYLIDSQGRWTEY